MPHTILVTGGSGFIAGHIIDRLLGDGHRVRATVRAPEKGASLEDRGAETVVADLTKDAGWNEAADGCDYVLHTASPFPGGEPKDPQDLIRPAVEGTERVLRAAARAKVKRAVVTSSVAAVAYGQPSRPEGVFTEEDWTDPDADIGAYTKSKTLAEKAAWRVAEGEGLDLATINPALVTGPLGAASHGTSVGLVRQLLTGKLPAAPQIGFGVVDVRDVASAHIAAMTAENAGGERFILCDRYMRLPEMAAVLRQAFPGHKVTTRTMPDAAVRLLAPFSSQLRQVKRDLGKRRAASGQKAQTVLGIDYVPAPESIVATGHSLIEHGLA